MYMYAIGSGFTLKGDVMGVWIRTIRMWPIGWMSARGVDIPNGRQNIELQRTRGRGAEVGRKGLIMGMTRRFDCYISLTRADARVLIINCSSNGYISCVYIAMGMLMRKLREISSPFYYYVL